MKTSAIVSDVTGRLLQPEETVKVKFTPAVGNTTYVLDCELSTIEELMKSARPQKRSGRKPKVAAAS